jgi:energy-coupling factor transporter ATP-binding protein EcfA2
MVQLTNPSLEFSAEDCEVFKRYPNSANWKDVSLEDQEIFKSVWRKLKVLSEKLAEIPAAPIPLKASTSLYTPNGRSPKEIWSCVYPLEISNKSYGLQVALIISERGAELCFCQGSGTSQVADPAKKRELERHFANMRRRLASVSQELVAVVGKLEKREWFYRKSWLTQPNETDFPSLTEWLAYASNPEGSAASVSHYFSPAELETLGTGIFDAFQDTLNTFGPILRAVYSTPASSRYWIFQGNPDQFDLDVYIRGRQEILWSVRQHKDRILPGDRVLLWRSGAAGGVIADCSVVDPPSKEILEDAPELWKAPSDIQAGEMRCRLRVENSFAEIPIARAVIRAVLPELSIVKAPQGTNFEITRADYEQIMKLREPATNEPFDAKSVDAFEKALRDEGVIVSSKLVIRMLSSLISKNLVLLTGLAGSGKTKIAQALARWLPASSSCFRVVAVGADWTGNENVLGYPNGLEKASYFSKPSLDLILHAKSNQEIPHFLILDEMNLSHVERYFSDILSAIESGEKIHLYQDSERRSNGTTIPAEVELPKNLFIIGTVNVDETTYMFSPKVLDRANVIEFRMDATDLERFLENPCKPNLSNLGGKGEPFGKAFVAAATSQVTVPADVKAAYDAEMLLLFKTLQEHGAEFGYRTAYETARFIHFYKLLGNHADGDVSWFPGAFDCVVFQKLLPKLHGSRAKLGPVLKKLWFLCVTAPASRGEDALKAAAESKAEPVKNLPEDAPYPLSAEKIYRMWRLMMDNGFTSFAEA